MSSARKVLAFARASYPCEADSNEELSFLRGDVLDIYEIGNDGWWTATLGKHAGLVPQQYLKPVQNVDALLHFIRLYYSNVKNIFAEKNINQQFLQQAQQLMAGGMKHSALVQCLYKCNPYALAQVVKDQLKGQQTSLIPAELYNTIVSMDTSLGGSGYNKQIIAPLNNLLKSKISNLQYLTLSALFRTLGSLTNININLLAYSFGPLILRPEVQNLDTLAKHQKVVNNITLFLIENAGGIFNVPIIRAKTTTNNSSYNSTSYNGAASLSSNTNSTMKAMATNSNQKPRNAALIEPQIMQQQQQTGPNNSSTNGLIYDDNVPMVSPSSITRKSSSNSLRGSIITLEPVQTINQTNGHRSSYMPPPTTVMQPTHVSAPNASIRQSSKPIPPTRTVNKPTPPTRMINKQVSQTKVANSSTTPIIMPNALTTHSRNVNAQKSKQVKDMNRPPNRVAPKAPVSSKNTSRINDNRRDVIDNKNRTFDSLQLPKKKVYSDEHPPTPKPRSVKPSKQAANTVSTLNNNKIHDSRRDVIDNKNRTFDSLYKPQKKIYSDEHPPTPKPRAVKPSKQAANTVSTLNNNNIHNMEVSPVKIEQESIGRKGIKILTSQNVLNSPQESSKYKQLPIKEHAVSPSSRGNKADFLAKANMFSNNNMAQNSHTKVTKEHVVSPSSRGNKADFLAKANMFSNNNMAQNSHTKVTKEHVVSPSSRGNKADFLAKANMFSNNNMAQNSHTKVTKEHVVSPSSRGNKADFLAKANMFSNKPKFERTEIKATHLQKKKSNFGELKTKSSMFQSKPAVQKQIQVQQNKKKWSSSNNTPQQRNVSPIQQQQQQQQQQGVLLNRPISSSSQVPRRNPQSLPSNTTHVSQPPTQGIPLVPPPLPIPAQGMPRMPPPLPVPAQGMPRMPPPLPIPAQGMPRMPPPLPTSAMSSNKSDIVRPPKMQMGDLFAEIRAGRSLKKAAPSTRKGRKQVGGGGGGIMAQMLKRQEQMKAKRLKRKGGKRLTGIDYGFTESIITESVGKNTNNNTSSNVTKKPLKKKNAPVVPKRRSTLKGRGKPTPPKRSVVNAPRGMPRPMLMARPPPPLPLNSGRPPPPLPINSGRPPPPLPINNTLPPPRPVMTGGMGSLLAEIQRGKKLKSVQTTTADERDQKATKKKVGSSGGNGGGVKALIFKRQQKIKGKTKNRKPRGKKRLTGIDF